MLRVSLVAAIVSALAGCAAPGQGIVAVLTDYGGKDHYVGALVANVLRANPHARIHTLTHEVEPFNVMQGAFILAECVCELPAGAVVLGVIDPGVGTDRKPIVIRTAGGHLLVGPDNGLFDLAVQRDGGAAEVRTIENESLMRPGPTSYTFHGRDIFGPVAGALSLGVPLVQVGPAADGYVRLNTPAPTRQRDGVAGVIVHVDYYGNLLTNIPASWMSDAPLGSAFDVVLGKHTQRVTWRHTYGDVAVGEFLALTTASGFVEIARNQQSAATSLEAVAGDAVQIRMPKP